MTHSERRTGRKKDKARKDKTRYKKILPKRLKWKRNNVHDSHLYNREN